MNIQRSNMEKVKVFNLITMAVAFLALVPLRESNIVRPLIAPRPLCATQISLANYACSTLPFTPWPPSFPMRSDDQGHGHHHRHQHGHGHEHGHGHRHRQLTPQEQNCCRWAKEVDSRCVCELLVRLPPFLMRPLHQYSLTLGDSCGITYSCGGPI